MSEGCTKVMFANTERYCSLLLWKQVAKPVFNLSVGHIGQNITAVPWPYIYLSNALVQSNNKQQGPF